MIQWFQVYPAGICIIAVKNNKTARSVFVLYVKYTLFKTCLPNFQDCLNTTGIVKKIYIHVSTRHRILYTWHMIQSEYMTSFLAAQNRF